MTSHEISYRRKPGGELAFWALCAGGRGKAERIARSLLEDLRDRHAKPQVLLDGRRVRCLREKPVHPPSSKELYQKLCENIGEVGAERTGD